jgi:hypothetical protein
MPAWLESALSMHCWICFVSMKPNADGSVSFTTSKGGDKDHKFNIIHVKKINSLFSWYHNITSALITRWFDLDDTVFQVWHILPSTPALGVMLPNPEGIPTSSSPIYNFHRSVKHSVSKYITLQKDHLWYS